MKAAGTLSGAEFSRPSSSECFLFLSGFFSLEDAGRLALRSLLCLFSLCRFSVQGGKFWVLQLTARPGPALTGLSPFWLLFTLASRLLHAAPERVSAASLCWTSLAPFSSMFLVFTTATFYSSGSVSLLFSVKKRVQWATSWWTNLCI